jgi:hypothetical protein
MAQKEIEVPDLCPLYMSKFTYCDCKNAQYCPEEIRESDIMTLRFEIVDLITFPWFTDSHS